MEKTVRINKALADAGVCSRRRADELIAAGRVSVNGEATGWKWTASPSGPLRSPPATCC